MLLLARGDDYPVALLPLLGHPDASDDDDRQRFMPYIRGRRYAHICIHACRAFLPRARILMFFIR